MNAVRRFFVTAKHWQLFLIFFGPFFVATALDLTQVWSAEELFRNWLLSTALSIIMCVYIILWIWSYGSFLTSVTSEAIRLKLRFFVLAIILFFIYVPLSNIGPASIRDSWLLDFFWLFCAAYAASFITRSLIRAETGNRGTFTDHVVTFCLVWMWPIGIWFIQPRINRLFAANNAHGTPVPAH